MSTQSQIEVESHKDPETLEREIEQQRSNIGNIVNALENKLSPGQLVDQALAFTKDNGAEFFNNLGTTLKNNPVPTVLTSIGLAWLMLGQNRTPPVPRPTYSMGEFGADGGVRNMADGVRDSFGRAADAVSGAVDHAKESLRHGREAASARVDYLSDGFDTVKYTVNERSHHMADSLRHQSDSVRNGFDYLLREQPLALAAMGIAIGALIGTALPSTPQENRLMGQASDRLTDEAKRLMREGYDKVAETGKAAMENVQRRAASSTRSPADEVHRPDEYGATDHRPSSN
ncbi:hypothetical protein DM872_06620 [Pseudomonas taiwanensis]|uniref:DUF3618 domain-containing protein n=1 Tax=Pseudomonas taiwanensis TaxID=470150 RepID=UPI0015BA728B|nr:DUF3618 domain-containing protein [Pseudomonas taiwanensis]NWL76522.1 hypothetical protein [Pseudomonas taiwanensis]